MFEGVIQGSGCCFHQPLGGRDYWLGLGLGLGFVIGSWWAPSVSADAASAVILRLGLGLGSVIGSWWAPSVSVDAASVVILH